MRGKTERLESIVEELRDLFGSHHDDEPLVIRASHDAGMRLRRDLIAETGAQDRASVEAPPVVRPDGEHAYELRLGGVRIEWPARRIDLGGGRYRYL